MNEYTEGKVYKQKIPVESEKQILADPFLRVLSKADKLYEIERAILYFEAETTEAAYGETVEQTIANSVDATDLIRVKAIPRGSSITMKHDQTGSPVTLPEINEALRNPKIDQPLDREVVMGKLVTQETLQVDIGRSLPQLDGVEHVTQVLGKKKSLHIPSRNMGKKGVFTPRDVFGPGMVQKGLIDPNGIPFKKQWKSVLAPVAMGPRDSINYKDFGNGDSKNIVDRLASEMLINRPDVTVVRPTAWKHSFYQDELHGCFNKVKFTNGVWLAF